MVTVRSIQKHAIFLTHAAQNTYELGILLLWYVQFQHVQSQHANILKVKFEVVQKHEQSQQKYVKLVLRHSQIPEFWVLSMQVLESSQGPGSQIYFIKSWVLVLSVGPYALRGFCVIIFQYVLYFTAWKCGSCQLLTISVGNLIRQAVHITVETVT